MSTMRELRYIQESLESICKGQWFLYQMKNNHILLENLETLDIK